MPSRSGRRGGVLPRQARAERPLARLVLPGSVRPEAVLPERALAGLVLDGQILVLAGRIAGQGVLAVLRVRGAGADRVFGL